MAGNDRNEDDARQPRSQRRRRRPPVLELKATEVGGDEKKTRSDKGKSESKSRPSQAWRIWRERVAGVDWNRLASPIVLTGVTGVVAGAAAVLVVVMLTDRGADPRLGTLAEQVSSLSARIETLAMQPPAGVDQDTLGQRIDQLTATIGEAERRLAAIEDRPSPPQPDLSEIQERSAAIETTLAELRAALADLRTMAERSPAAATPAALNALTGRIGGLEERIAALADMSAPMVSPTALAAVAALNSLASAIESGRPFLRELDTARALISGEAETLAALAPGAEKGLPTIVSLTQQFTELVPSLLRDPEPEGDFLSRLFTQAVRLVEVRPVGEPEGTTAGAVIARMETRLGRGDLSGALAEAALLPDPARTRAAAWIALATQRHDAELTVKRLIDSALAASAERARP